MFNWLKRDEFTWLNKQGVLDKQRCQEPNRDTRGKNS